MKLIPATTMKMMMMNSIAGLAKLSMLAFRVENPPVAIVEKVWQMASK